MISNELADDVAIVTGSGVNTGSVIAMRLAASGAAVVVNYRRAEKGANVQAAGLSLFAQMLHGRMR
jgi:NAD(P)-dependent dehydrogenase (short-subunit alcohol dehydrogenase family)